MAESCYQVWVQTVVVDYKYCCCNYRFFVGRVIWSEGSQTNVSGQQASPVKPNREQQLLQQRQALRAIAYDNKEFAQTYVQAIKRPTNEDVQSLSTSTARTSGTSRVGSRQRGAEMFTQQQCS